MGTSAEYGCFGNSFSLFFIASVCFHKFGHLEKKRASRQRLQAGTPRKMENPGPVKGWGVGTVSQKYQNSHDSAAFQCDQKGIQESLRFFWVSLVWHHENPRVPVLDLSNWVEEEANLRPHRCDDVGIGCWDANLFGFDRIDPIFCSNTFFKLPKKCHQNRPMMQCGLHVVSHVTVDGCKLHFCNVGIPGIPIEDKASSCLGQKVISVVRLSRSASI